MVPALARGQRAVDWEATQAPACLPGYGPVDGQTESVVTQVSRALVFLP